MALKINSGNYGLPSLVKEGTKHFQGLEEAVYRNIGVCRELADITKSSFGPNGLNKLVVNHLDKLFLTNDAGTILRELEIQHPACRLVLMASQQQDKEIGDGSNLVVILAGELLNNAEQLLRIGLSPSVIVEGYEIAHKKAVEFLEELVVKTIPITPTINKEEMKFVVKTTLASKQYGLEEKLAELVVNASMMVMPSTLKNFSVDNVRCVKVMGGSLAESYVINGMVLGRQPESRLRHATKAKVAVYSCPLSITRTETKGTVLLSGAQEMLEFSKGEESAIEAQFKAIADSGVKILITGDTIGELALHFVDRLGLIALKVPSKFDLRRICKTVGALPLARLGAPTEEEAGWVHTFETIEIGGDRVTVLRQEETTNSTGASKVATIVLRGNSQSGLDDLERAIEDGVNAIRTMVSRDSRLVVGAGAAEIELARKLTAFGEKTPGVIQYAIKKYAEAFEIVPRILAINSGYDPTDAISKLYWAHDQGNGFGGIDVDGSTDDAPLLRNAQPVALDLFEVKKMAMYLATDVALTVLRVDQIILSKPAGGPKPRAPGPMDGDD